MSNLAKRKKEKTEYELSTTDDEERPVRSAPRRKKRKERPRERTLSYSSIESNEEEGILLSDEDFERQGIIEKYEKLTEELQDKKNNELRERQIFDRKQWEKRRLENLSSDDKEESIQKLDDNRESTEEPPQAHNIMKKYTKLCDELLDKEHAELCEFDEVKRKKKMESEKVMNDKVAAMYSRPLSGWDEKGILALTENIKKKAQESEETLPE